MRKPLKESGASPVISKISLADFQFSAFFSEMITLGLLALTKSIVAQLMLSANAVGFPLQG